MLEPSLKRQMKQCTKFLTPRGLRQVTVKNSSTIDPCVTRNDNQSKVHITQPGQLDSGKMSNQANYQNNLTEIALTLLQKCFKPLTPKLKQNLFQADQIDSRVILKINSLTVDTTPHKEKQLRCVNIKIGSKAQKYGQNNKSQPKKVSNLGILSSIDQTKLKDLQTNYVQIQYDSHLVEKTQRKSSPNKFISNKNSPPMTEFSKRLNKFDQDLKKTKKSKIVKLQLNLSKNNSNIRQNRQKDYVSLKNFEQPNIQHSIQNNIKIFPTFQSRGKYISDSLIPTQIKNPFQYNHFKNNEGINALEKTKKIVWPSLQTYKMIIPNLTQQKLEQKTQITQRNINSLEGLISKEEIKFVIDRFRSFDQRLINVDQRLINVEKTVAFKQQTVNDQLQINQQNRINFPQPTYKHSEQSVRSANMKCQQLRPTNMYNLKSLSKFAQTLRVTDYDKNDIHDQGIQSPVSEHRKSQFNTKHKSSAAQNKLKYLNQGAKTIITKYDSSEKRSIIDESVILFQCSKDLKQCFSRDNLNDYAAKYRGSLGMNALINENYDQQQFVSSKNLIYHEECQEQNQRIFDKMLLSPKNNNKMRKSYSIKQIEALTIKF